MGRLKNQILAKVLTRFPKLLDKIIEKTESITVEGIPWTPLKKPIKDCKIALVTTAGVHLKAQEPFDMLDKDGDPTYRELPSSAPREQYTITHDYYDHTDADKDLNIVFPLDRIRELKLEGKIGELAEVNFGFMGHIDAHHIETLVKKTAVEVADKLKRQNVDVVLLTPG
ncbi:MAG: hypothetical protein HYS21_05060 [Deltaproteobacteria bacterium]|nr:hypothetical protein [Deltaproteobacteria bacterium]